MNRLNNGPLKSARFGGDRSSGQNAHTNGQNEKELKETGKLGDTMASNKTQDLKEL